MFSINHAEKSWRPYVKENNPWILSRAIKPKRNSKCMLDLNVKVKSTKLLVENTGGYLLELELQRFIIQSTESISN